MRVEIKRLLKEVVPHKKKILFIAITGISYSAAYARLVMILKDINDSFQTGRQDLVAQVSILALGLALIVAISRYFHIYTMNYVAELIVSSLRLQLQNKFMRLNLSFHNKYISGSGGLLSRILNDVKVIQDGLRMLADFFREPLLAVLLLFNLFYLNWRLTLFTLILLPIVLFFLRQISKSLRKYVLWGQENLERMTSTIKESLDGLRIIQSFNLENEMAKKLRQESEEFVEIRRKVHSHVEIMSPVTEFIATALILSIFFYFSVEVAKGNISTGAVLAYIASMMAINQPIKKLQESYVRIQETIVSAQRIFQILDEKSEVPQTQNGIPFPKNWKAIEYKNVSFNYGQENVLKNINLRIERGQQLAFVGESGSGKSTIVNLLERFFDPTDGEILVDGISIRQMDLKSLRENIALVSQDVFLFSDTIEKNILAGNFNKSPEEAVAAAKSANAHEFILKNSKGYQARVGDRGNLLSGGEKQRISLARAFVKDSPILILDEATSALDSASEIEVQKGIERLMQGKTSLIIAHRLSTVQNADKIFVLNKGQIVEMGTHRELLALQGHYAHFSKLQNSHTQN